MGIKLIRIGAIYLMIGMGLGVYMGATGDHTLHPVHAHINLLGWTLLGLSGLMFHTFPQLEQSKLATVFFWLYNVSVPYTMVCLILIMSGYPEVEPLAGIGSVLILVSGVCLAVLLLTKLPSAKGA